MSLDKQAILSMLVVDAGAEHLVADEIYGGIADSPVTASGGVVAVATITVVVVASKYAESRC